MDSPAGYLVDRCVFLFCRFLCYCIILLLMQVGELEKRMRDTEVFDQQSATDSAARSDSSDSD